MEYFERFHSNTLAGSGNQHIFTNDSGITTSCMLYKVTEGGEYPYSFLFSNTMDSTYSDGQISHKNMVLDSWKIESMRVGITDFCCEDSFKMPSVLNDVLFCGSNTKTVNPAELFCSDPITLFANDGEYIYLEISFSGKTIPYHDESIIPSFVKKDGEWIPSKLHPFPSMIGAELSPKKKIAFLGDSITQGIGTPVNSYEHWNAVFAKGMGSKYSYWNLGLGFGRADDAASDGIWLYKAKKNDIVFVCFGVNDIIQGFSAETIKKNLQTIVDKLKSEGIFVIAQTVPPFELCAEHKELWFKMTDFVKNELRGADVIFDCAAVISDENGDPIYGGHPNGDGCKIWGAQLLKAMKEVL